MTDTLDKAIRVVYADLALLKPGSIRAAQAFVKKLREAGKKRQATNLVREINKQARKMHRENW